MGNSRDRDTIHESFLKKGFQQKDGGDHLRYIYLSSDGKKTAVHTKMSRGSKYKYLSDPLIAQMAKQCMLAKSDFLALVDCPLTRQDYENKLKQHGAI
jgi:hypothetical protein